MPNLDGETSDPNLAGVFGKNTGQGGVGVAGVSDSGDGVRAVSTSGNGLSAFTSNGFNAAVFGKNTGKAGVAVAGVSDSGDGVRAVSTSGNGLSAFSTSSSAVFAKASGNADGVFGTSQGTGVHGDGPGPSLGSTVAIGVVGTSASGSGVAATNSNSNFPVILGRTDSPGGTGVVGYARAATGVGVGVIGVVDSTAGVGTTGLPVPVGVWGRCAPGGLAGFFDGDLLASQDMTVRGTFTAAQKLFKIDHPLDPANKYLVHATVESYEMIDVYTGNITTDQGGHATVRLPNYIQAMHNDFRYQLTVVGKFAQAIVSEEIENNQFAIKTDKPNVKVSWQVAAVRQDSFAKANPLVTEEDKALEERGLFLHPELFGQPEEKRLGIPNGSSLAAVLNFDIK